MTTEIQPMPLERVRDLLKLVNTPAEVTDGSWDRARDALVAAAPELLLEVARLREIVATRPTFSAQLELGNAAFGADVGGPFPELGRILAELADRFDSAEDTAPASGSLRDVNGNTVGQWVIS